MPCNDLARLQADLAKNQTDLDENAAAISSLELERRILEAERMVLMYEIMLCMQQNGSQQSREPEPPHIRWIRSRIAECKRLIERLKKKRTK